MGVERAAPWAAHRHKPAVGATVVFQPHVQGASSAGHVGHVEKVYGNGWFLISEMAFYWNGGGFGACQLPLRPHRIRSELHLLGAALHSAVSAV